MRGTQVELLNSLLRLEGCKMSGGMRRCCSASLHWGKEQREQTETGRFKVQAESPVWAEFAYEVVIQSAFGFPRVYNAAHSITAEVG